MKSATLARLLAAVLLATSAACDTAVQSTFSTPEEAGEALIAAAERFDVNALKGILGPDGVDLVVTDDSVQDGNQARAFAAQARAGTRIDRDPGDPKRAALVVGSEDWPLPIPIVEEAGRWRFDSKAGRDEIVLRRIGDNELDAIELCRGYVEAQYEYASEKRGGSPVHQYAQRIVSTPGQQDGLAWRDAAGNWQGPVGEAIAGVIAEGYTDRYEPYHGYYYKILKKQGPHAPLGELDFVVKGVMIGGFALVAAPADYAVTGVKTFLVGHDGIVYERDLGPDTVDLFRATDSYDPDDSWSPVTD
jgi:hypothetical protein